MTGQRLFAATPAHPGRLHLSAQSHVRAVKSPLLERNGGLSLKLPRRNPLTANAECCNQLCVTSFVFALEVVKKRTTAGNEGKKTTTGVVVLLVALEVLSQVVDTLCEDSNLYFWRTSVAFLGCIFLDEGSFTLCSNRHRVILSMSKEKEDALSRDVV